MSSRATTTGKYFFWPLLALLCPSLVPLNLFLSYDNESHSLLLSSLRACMATPSSLNTRTYTRLYSVLGSTEIAQDIPPSTNAASFGRQISAKEWRLGKMLNFLLEHCRPVGRWSGRLSACPVSCLYYLSPILLLLPLLLSFQHRFQCRLSFTFK